MPFSKNHFIFLYVFVYCMFGSPALAQVERPNREILFSEDDKRVKAAREKEVIQALKTDKGLPGIDFKAPDVEFDQENNIISGRGGVLISNEGTQIQAEQGSLNLDTKDTELEGRLLFTADEGHISADRGNFNLDSERGDFENAEIVFEQGGYQSTAKILKKISETRYHLCDAVLNTCHCADGSKSWNIHGQEADVEQEGYAHVYGATLYAGGVPILYSPYVGYPVKLERQSGLLKPEFGYGNRDGLQFRIPLFLVLDNYSDLTLTPFIEAKTRKGIVTDYRKAFSSYNTVTTRMVYSDESARDGDLRGTKVNDLFDPTFDENRFGGFYRQVWKSSAEAVHPVSMIADLHYVSDDLFFREIDDEDIGRQNARYSTSRVLANTSLGSYATAELSGEFNQALLADDDLIFQRLPELRLNWLRSFSPFGPNLLGAKIVTLAGATGTEFVRKEGYDGLRIDLNPSIKIPLHFKNYLNLDLTAGVRKTYYKLRDSVVPNGTAELKSSNERLVGSLGAAVSTELERVYDVSGGSWLNTLASLGYANQNSELIRLKHTITPSVSFIHIPDTTQDDLPVFDSLDRIRERSLFTFNLRTALLGRFNPKTEALDAIPELVPEIKDLPVLNFDTPLGDFGTPETLEVPAGASRLAKGEIRNLVVLNLRQSYDYKEDIENNDAARNPWSDVAADLDLYPNKYFKMRFESDWRPRENTFSTWGVAMQFRDDRGDSIKGRYSFIDRRLSQLDGNLELKLTGRLKAGYYGKYDDTKGEFLEQKFALRLSSLCDCWKVDFGYRQEVNPDRDTIGITVTLKGLGDLGS